MHTLRRLACAAALAAAAGCTDRADALLAPPDEALVHRGRGRGLHGPPAGHPGAGAITFAQAMLTLVRGQTVPVSALGVSILGAPVPNGHPVLSDPKAWSTSDPSVAVVQGDVLSALAVGTATITLTAQGRAGSLGVTVADPHSAGAGADSTAAASAPPTEPSDSSPPAGLEWPDVSAEVSILDEQTWSGVAAPWYSISKGGLVSVTSGAASADALASPGSALEFRFPRGFDGGGAPGIVYREAGSFGREVLIGFDYKMSEGWQFHDVADKLFYLVHGNPNSPCAGPHGRMAYALMVQTAGGVPHLMMNEEYYNSNRIQPNRGTRTAQTVASGRWHRVQMYIRASSSAFRPDGVIRIWTNGALTHEYADQPTPACNFYEAQFAPVWGGVGDYKQQDDYLWIDHTSIGRR